MEGTVGNRWLLITERASDCPKCCSNPERCERAAKPLLCLKRDEEIEERGKRERESLWDMSNGPATVQSSMGCTAKGKKERQKTRQTPIEGWLHRRARWDLLEMDRR